MLDLLSYSMVYLGHYLVAGSMVASDIKHFDLTQHTQQKIIYFTLQPFKITLF